MQQINPEDLILNCHFDVTSADTDMQARLRPGALVNFLIQSAIQSADSLGFGFRGLKQHQLFWVASRLNIEIYRSLKWYEKVVVETWPKDVDGLLYLRDFFVRDQQENLVAKATSGWLAVDLESKRPRKVDELHSGLFTQLKDKFAFKDSPVKLPAVKDGTPFQFKSTYFDLDLNNHVTSTRYIDWMMDTIPYDYHLKHYPKHLSINFMKEIKFDETIELYRHQESESQFHFDGIHSTSGSSAFRGIIEF